MNYYALTFSNTHLPAVIPQRSAPDAPRLVLDESAMAAMTDFIPAVLSMMMMAISKDNK